MKSLIMLILLVTAHNKVYALDGDFYRDTHNMELSLDTLAKQEGFAKEVLKKQAQRIVHKFMNEEMRSEDIAKEFELMVSNGPIDDIYKKIEELIIKIYGSKIGKVIVAVLGFSEVKSSIEDVRNGIILMRKNPSCEEGMTKLSTGIAFIVGFAGVYYYMQMNPAAIFLANAGGIIAKESCRLVLEITDLPQMTCDLIHKRKFKYGH